MSQKQPRDLAALTRDLIFIRLAVGRASTADEREFWLMSLAKIQAELVIHRNQVAILEGQVADLSFVIQH